MAQGSNDIMFRDSLPFYKDMYQLKIDCINASEMAEPKNIMSILNYYKKMRNLYKYVSAYVHSKKNNKIDTLTILKHIYNSIKNVVTFTEEKKQQQGLYEIYYYLNINLKVNMWHDVTVTLKDKIMIEYDLVPTIKQNKEEQVEQFKRLRSIIYEIEDYERRIYESIKEANLELQTTYNDPYHSFRKGDMY
jgi:hypothetical protein